MDKVCENAGQPTSKVPGLKADRHAASSLSDGHISIIGCGFGGIGMAIQLKKAGHHNFTIFEKSSTIGGTWSENTYPGCGCDIPSATYSFSFENYPEWDRLWAKQPQILEYQKHCMRKYELYPHLKCSSMMRLASWNADSSSYTLLIEDLRTSHNYEVHSTFVVMAHGALHVPQYPSIPGVDPQQGTSSFHGPSFHSAEWDHNIDFKGKRVGVIGSGASSIQIVPEIANEAKALFVFQRTAPYVLYKADMAIPNMVKNTFRYFPFSMKIFRWSVYIATEFMHSALYLKSFMNKWIKWNSIKYLKSVVVDENLQNKLIPTCELGCKRMLFSSFWYPALTKPNVHVVTNKVVGVCESGIQIQESGVLQKVIDLDIVVYATGFQYTRRQAPMKHKFDILGVNDVSYNRWFQESPKCLLGINANEFPNLFFLYGPNTNLGHSSIIFMIECQINYIIKLLRMAQNKNMKRIQVKKEVVDEYFSSHIRSAFAGKVWETCSSWYRWPVKNKITGEYTLTGEIFSLWPSTTLWYYWMTLWPTLGHFEPMN